MASRGSVKLSIYSTFKDDGTKKAERAISQFAKKYGELDKSAGTYKIDEATRALLEQSVQADLAAAKWQGYSDKLAAAGAAITKYVSAASGAAVAASTKMASDYEDSFAKVKTIMDKQAEPPAELSREILDLSTSTGKSATELAEATYQALSASVETSKAAGFVSDAVKLAKVGFTDTSSAVDVLTTTINAYGMSADDAGMITGRLVQTQNKGKTTVNELASSMGNVIPTASAYNVSLDNLCSAYVVMTKQGINTANATTAVNGMLTELASEGSTVATILKDKTGKSFGQLMADGMSLGDVLQVLNEHVGGNSEEFANLWGNVRASKGALAIANAGAGEFSQAMADMANSAGLVDSALEDLATPSAKANKAINAVKNAGIELGEEFLGALTPGLEAAASAAQGLYRDFSQMDQGQKQATAGMLAVAAASGPAVLGLSKVAGGVSTALGKYGELRASLARHHEAALKSARAAEALGAAGAKDAASATRAAKAWRVLGAVTSGPVVLGVAAAAIAIKAITKGVLDWKKRTDEVSKAQGKLYDVVRSGSPTVSGATADLSAYGAQASRTRVSIEDVTRAQAELADAMSERNEAAQAEINRLQGAREVLDQYMNQTGLTAQEQGRLRDAVNYVNEACGTQYQVVDAANGVISDEEGAILDTCAAIDQYIEKKQEQIRLDALSENLTELYKQQADDIAAVAQAQRDYNEAVAAFREADEAGLTGEAWQGYAQAVDDAKRSLDEAQGDLDSVNDAIKATEMRMGSLGKAASGAEMSIGELAATRVEIQQIIPPEQLEAFCRQLDESGIAVEAFSALTQGQMMDLAASYDGSTESIIAAAERMGVDVPKATSDGMEGATAAIEQATPEQKAAANKTANAILASWGRLKAEAPAEGSAGAEGYAGGIASGEGKTSEAAGLIARAAEKMKEGDHYDWGHHAAENFAAGLRDGNGLVSSAVQSISSTVSDYLKHSVARKGELHEGGKGEALWGEHAVRNFAEGIESNAGLAARASAAAARAAAEGFRAVSGGIYAPSPVRHASGSPAAEIDYDRLARAIARAVGRPEMNVTVNEAESAELTAARVAARMREEAMCA